MQYCIVLKTEEFLTKLLCLLHIFNIASDNKLKSPERIYSIPYGVLGKLASQEA